MIKCSTAITVAAGLISACVSQNKARSDRGAHQTPEVPSQFVDHRDNIAESSQPILAKIQLAQTHVLPPESELLSLVSDRSTLLKVDLLAKESGATAPTVFVEMQLGTNTLKLPLTGPRLLPTDPVSDPAFASSFTVMLPKEWFRPGLKLKISAGSLVTEVQPKIGAPNPLSLTLLHFQFFKQPKALPEPSGWEAELVAKLPIAQLALTRKSPWFFSELVIPPRADVKVTAKRVRSPEEYREKARLAFDGEQGLVLGLTNALQVAAGENRLSVYYSFVSGIGVGGGLADSFTAMGGDGNYAVFLHELGHTLSLPHWANNMQYPYQSDMDGLQGDPGHVGLTWGFDGRQGRQGDIILPYFIPPTVQPNTVGRTPGTLKKDPMAGGGSGDQEKGFLFRMFSDFSVRKMQQYLEQELVLWDESQKQYVKWDKQKESYQMITTDGVNYPVQRNVPVISILYSTSAVTPEEANFIYTPIGPHISSLIRTFDPSQAEDLEAARQAYCKPSCDFTLRVLRGNKVKDYIVRGTWKPDADEFNPNSQFVGALNLPAAEGPIQQIDLLLTPRVESSGLPAAPKLLARYVAPVSP
jgi:hypothetical protein